MLPGTSFNYKAEVGDGLSSGVITAALCWIMRSFPEAPCIVESRSAAKDALWEVETGHPLEDLLDQPNPYYDGGVLWMSTVLDFAFGEAFWQKIRNGKHEVVELWWIPRALITPIYDDQRWPGVWIHHYEYKVGGRSFELPVEDVVHFRFGMDPRDPRRGFSQLAALFREVYIDDQAANFTASILRNLGIIGLVFSPKTGGTPIPPGKLDEFKKYVQENFTADKRGQAMAFSNPIDAQVLAYNLQGFNVGPLRDISEERVCAALGIPAAVIGFGTGLQQTKVGATMREMIQLAWRGSIMPTQKAMARELKRSLVGEFQKQASRYRVRFDVSKIHALWEDDQQKAQRVATTAENSLITVGEARRELGYPADAKHDFYLRKVTVQAVPADEPMKPVARITETSPTPPPAPGSEEETGKVKPPGEGEPEEPGDPVA
jgi:HK97 family phage portal protein